MGAVKRSRAETPPKAPELLIWVVARDGIEPPTPAFSGPRSTTELPGLSADFQLQFLRGVRRCRKGWADPRTVRCNDCLSISTPHRTTKPQPAAIEAPRRHKRKPLNVTALAPVIPFPQPSWEILMSVKKPTRREFLVATSTAALAAATPGVSSSTNATMGVSPPAATDQTPFTSTRTPSTRPAAHLQRRQGHPGSDAHRRHRRGLHLHQRLRRAAGLLDSHPARNHGAARGIYLQLARSCLRQFSTSRVLRQSPSSLKVPSRHSRSSTRACRDRGLRRGGFEGFPRFAEMQFPRRISVRRSPIRRSIGSARRVSHRLESIHSPRRQELRHPLRHS